MLSRQGAPSIRAELVAFTDAVELETFSGGRLQRRRRFLTDAAARRYAARLRFRLERRLFQERRTGRRTSAWPC
jgi:hypothetical protein